MKTIAAHPRLALLPRTDEIAVGHHVHGLEREAPVVAGIMQDALGAQQVLARARTAAAPIQCVEPLRIDRASQLEADSRRRRRCARGRRRRSGNRAPCSSMRWRSKAPWSSTSSIGTSAFVGCGGCSRTG